MRSAAILLLLAAATLAYPACAETVEGGARVIDGDTIEILEQRIRLWGIDAPEIAQRCTEGASLIPAA